MQINFISNTALLYELFRDLNDIFYSILVNEFWYSPSSKKPGRWVWRITLFVAGISCKDTSSFIFRPVHPFLSAHQFSLYPLNLIHFLIVLLAQYLLVHFVIFQELVKCYDFISVCMDKFGREWLLLQCLLVTYGRVHPDEHISISHGKSSTIIQIP